ncbi:MAG: hypothetical protein ACO3JL_12975 [Myxococcota bacterium]
MGRPPGSTGFTWVTHPRHLPAPPDGRVVVVDVAFAAGQQFQGKTLPFIRALGPRLLCWVDHHLHRDGWAHVSDDPRFVLVPNRVAHACPQLVTVELVQRVERGDPVDQVVAHADFDGLVAAVKWRRGGVQPWAEADEDACAVDSPGRGHSLSERGARLAYALEEASGRYSLTRRAELLGEVAASLVAEQESADLRHLLDELASAGRLVEDDARRLAERSGREEAPGVFVVRLQTPVENRVRKHLLMMAEERAPIGALFEPDPKGGAWVTAATFDERLDLEEVSGFAGGRSDYRFARAKDDGRSNIAALGRYLDEQL